MAAETLNPRTYPVTFDITAPRHQDDPHHLERAEPDRLLQRVEQIEHRLCLLEGGMATLLEAS